ncbi:hypothetical protein EV702DRAFT_1192124 [Suillus placidus]|uniref:ATPase AAA-type core domain-containing protein n=1 Tax=Suillus placidus TaxID=48579 RepID=A0A9P7D804_9AGAM|nr:hypothetical protein EV702DRAFT_1192124 [Suillus placidus]
MGGVFTKLIPRNTDSLKIELYVACGIWNPATPFVTGKTLLARALAASCRANGKGVSFFMRKGADCLSKWVGEAERQLRLLFEEIVKTNVALQELVPSSARSSSSSASPLPTQLVPLLSDTLEKVKDAINRVLPVSKKRTALEEAMWEDDSEANALDRELFIQLIKTLRVYRPRLVLHGSAGMGQGYLGAAALHHLEGYHVQTLDLGTLMGDSTWVSLSHPPDKRVLFMPSVIYLPSLDGWSAAVSETARSTVRSMLDSLAPTDPVLVLAIVDGPFSSLPRDVRSWFGMTCKNRLTLPSPTEAQRDAFFSSIIADIRRPPNQFADGIKRRKRILEELPIAPPLEPRQPTAAELAIQEENDQRVITLLKYRLGPILTELKRKFKRFTKKAREEYDFDPIPVANEVEIVTQEQPNGIINGIHPDPQPTEHPAPLPPSVCVSSTPYIKNISTRFYHLQRSPYPSSSRSNAATSSSTVPMLFCCVSSSRVAHVAAVGEKRSTFPTFH